MTDAMFFTCPSCFIKGNPSATEKDSKVVKAHSVNSSSMSDFFLMQTDLYHTSLKRNPRGVSYHGELLVIWKGRSCLFVRSAHALRRATGGMTGRLAQAVPARWLPHHPSMRLSLLLFLPSAWDPASRWSPLTAAPGFYARPRLRLNQFMHQ